MVGTAAAAAGATKATLNGTKNRVQELVGAVQKIDEKLSKHIEEEDAHLERLVRVETILTERSK